MAKKREVIMEKAEPELVVRLLDNLAECKRLLKEYVYTMQPKDDALWEGCFTAWAAVNRARKIIEAKLGQLPLPLQSTFIEGKP